MIGAAPIRKCRTIAQLDQWITYAAGRGEGLVAFYS